MWISIIYEFALWGLAAVAIPKMLYQLIVHKKYRQSLLRRFGSGFPVINKNGRPLIWIHAVSVGETKAVAPLAKLLKSSPKQPILVVSTITETGQAEAKRSIPEADFHIYLPFDFKLIINPIVKRVKPDMVILCETDFWYNFLKASKKAGAITAVVNGKISIRSQSRFNKVSFFTKSLFSKIDLFCIQSHHYKTRFLNLGVPFHKIAVTGNMKFDDKYPYLKSDELAQFKHQLGIKQDNQVLVMGSTHDPEESLLLQALKKVWQSFPNLKPIIVPRHPERFNEVATLLSNQNIPFYRYSSPSHNNEGAKVILIDAMGLLRKCYQIADIAVVAGSFTPKVGGHNILEPCWYGVPTIFGPNMYSQPEMLELVRQYNAGMQVPGEKLGETLEMLLKDSDQRKTLGDNGLKLVEDMKGATQKTYGILSNLLK